MCECVLCSKSCFYCHVLGWNPLLWRLAVSSEVQYPRCEVGGTPSFVSVLTSILSAEKSANTFWKINILNRKRHPIEMEHFLNQTSMTLGSMFVVFQGVCSHWRVSVSPAALEGNLYSLAALS